MPQIALPGATIEYRESGPADSAHPPVVFVHGALVDTRLWSGVAESLAAQGFRCVLPNLPLGSHRIPVDDRAILSPQGVAALIDEFLAALDLDNVTLVGNDTGGGICQFLIDARPGRIGRLVLTNCDAFDKFPPFPFNAVFALMRTGSGCGRDCHGASKLARVCATRCGRRIRPSTRSPLPVELRPDAKF